MNLRRRASNLIALEPVLILRDYLVEVWPLRVEFKRVRVETWVDIARLELEHFQVELVLLAD